MIPLVDASYLLDSNLLVYCFDEEEPEKRDRALTTIDPPKTSCERTGRTQRRAMCRIWPVHQSVPVDI